jgi:hypothetical protein
MSTAACQRRSAGSARGHKVGLLGPCDAFAQLSVAQPLLVTVTVLFADECPRGVAIVDSIAFSIYPKRSSIQPLAFQSAQTGEFS